MSPASEPDLFDATWFVVAAFVMLAVIACYFAWRDRRPSMIASVPRGPSAVDAGATLHGAVGDRASIELWSPTSRVRSIVDWSMSQADTGYGSVDLTRDPPSLAELEAGFLYGAVCTSATFDEDRLRDAWQALVDVCGSTERALLIDTRCRELRRREAAAESLQERAFGGRP